VSKINALTVGKIIASAVVGIGTERIIKNLVKQNIIPKNVGEKIVITVATGVIAAVVTQATKDYTDETIEKAVETGKKLVEKVKVGVKLAKINEGQSTFENEDLEEEEFEKNKKGKWVAKKPTEEQELAMAIMRINMGESTFKKEGLKREHYKQSASGYWSRNNF